MPRWQGEIRQAPGADGPFYVISNDVSGPVASAVNVTLGISGLQAALNQVTADIGPLVPTPVSATLDYCIVTVSAHATA